MTVRCSGDWLAFSKLHAQPDRRPAGPVHVPACRAAAVDGTSNIANADTPGFKTRDIEFRSELERASGGAPSVEVAGLAVRNDGNNVSLDREARNLAENSLRFQIATQFLQGQLRVVRAAIQEGRQ